MSSSHYIGRFAPSPTGPLHIGSLIAAVASYLDAHSQQGQWLLRMEDLDPPREMAGAAEAILTSLQRHGLHWHGEVLWQSRRHDAYRQAVAQLLRQHKAYYCHCSRADIQHMGGIYDGRCRGQYQPPAQAAAVRLQLQGDTIQFEDRIQGPISQSLQQQVGDFVIQRKDRLYAYQLAVVLDDHYQGVNQVLRGCDLLDSTPRQIHLQQQLGLPSPGYSHIPVISNSAGQKLSKQTFAPALDDSQPCRNLRQALQFLRQPAPPAELRQPAQLLAWASRHWQPQRISAVRQIDQATLDGDA